jgi:hypothetical protein
MNKDFMTKEQEEKLDTLLRLANELHPYVMVYNIPELLQMQMLGEGLEMKLDDPRLPDLAEELVTSLANDDDFNTALLRCIAEVCGDEEDLAEVV